MRSPVTRRALVAASILIAALCAASCQRNDRGETNVLVIGAQPRITDPASGALTEPQAVLLANVAQGLVAFDPSGQIIPGLAERWNVTDDGLSYIFRLQTAKWPDGRKITAQQVARLLRRQISARSNNALKDTLGAIDEITPMTDRVIEISLTAPRPHLLQLLAQPEFAIVSENQGSGPFAISPKSKPDALLLRRSVTSLDDDLTTQEDVILGGRPAPDAIKAFIAGETELVLGGTFADLAYARSADLPKTALRFDPAMGLFGLVPARGSGPVADLAFRRLLSQAIDRQALIDALNVPGLLPRATILEPGLDGVPSPVAPPWMSTPIDQRRATLSAAAERMIGRLDAPVIRIALPDSPGAKIMLSRLASDWGALGIKVEDAEKGGPADLRLIDLVAPSSSPAWYLRSFRCGIVSVCDAEADELLNGARAATVPAQRYGLFTQAAQRMDDQQLFIALTAPIRWSLVSTQMQGFANNRFATHTLVGLRQRPDRDRGE
ncbi:ABC transporter substrate-binding protein [Sphingomonas daechungensis]|uniref:ABC transporter substrate-binding protein n=1 Tax=Sphingomonas daechungensis TaxID=1176646 RepID=UPI0031E7C92B